MQWLKLLGAGLLAAASLTAAAQSPQPLPQLVVGQLSLNEAAVAAIARLPDGGALVGGAFLQVQGWRRDNLVRIRADGSVDPAWNPGTDGMVFGIALSGDGGTAIAWGSFRWAGGVYAPRLAKIDVASGRVDPDWQPLESATGNGVNEVAIAGNQVYISGSFSQIGGLPRTRIAKVSLSGSGAADANWNALAPGGSIDAIAVDTQGNAFVGGSFTEIGSAARYRLARLSAATGAALPWNPAVGNTTIGRIETLALSPDGSALYAGGSISQVNGFARNGAAKIAVANGAVDAQWNPDVNGGVASIIVSGAQIYLLGNYSRVGGIGRDTAARVSAVNGQPDGWNLGSVCSYICGAGGIQALAPFGNDDVLVGGDIMGLHNELRYSLARVARSDGALRPNLVDATAIGQVRTQVRLADGSVVFGGEFISINGVRRSYLAKLTPAGTLDFAWNARTNGPVLTLTTDAQNRIYVGGQFSSLNGANRAGLARLSASGVLDDWNSSPSCCGTVRALAVSGEENAVYVGGYFSTAVCGAPRNHIVKLSTDGTACAADPDFSLGADGSVNAIAFDDVSGNLFVGGTFGQVGGQLRQNIARLDPATGAAVIPWNPGANGEVRHLSLSNGHTLYAAGYFSQIASTSRPFLARFLPSGQLDTNWIPPAPNNGVNTLALQGTTVYVGGGFTHVGTAPRAGVARLGASDGALDPAWRPAVEGTVRQLSVFGDELWVAGGFSRVSQQLRTGLVRFATTDYIFASGME